MSRPSLQPDTQLFSARLYTRILAVVGVTSLALPAACGGSGSTATTTTTTTAAHGSGGGSSATGAGGMTVSSTDSGLGAFDAGIPPDANLDPPPPGTDCFDWTADAGPCPTDPTVVIFEFAKYGCPDGGGSASVEPYIIDSGPTQTDGQCCYTVEYQFCLTGGRPYVVAERARVADPTRRHGPSAWSQDEPPTACCVDALTSDERSALAAAWTADALLEHASVASFSRFSLALMAAGAPAELVELAHRAALDEVQHARLCFALASAYAGESVGPGPFPVGDRVDVGASLASLAASTVREGCIGETVAAVVAAEQLARATDPAVREALARIADDEARHAELAWRTVAWALEIGGREVREAVAQAFRAAASPHVASAQTSPAGDLREAMAAHGRLDPATTANVVAAAMTGLVAPSARALLQRS